MRLIDADTIPYTMLYKENWIKGTGREEQGVWKSDIDKMPTIEPKRGWWTTAYGDHIHAGLRPVYIYCSECGMVSTVTWNYCPNCGAKMGVDE